MARLNKWERQHLKDLSALDKRIEQIYEAAIKEAARIGATISDFNPDRLFFQRLSNYTQKNRKAVVGAKKRVVGGDSQRHKLCLDAIKQQEQRTRPAGLRG